MLPQLKRDADGGLTLLIQNESPGKDREANWLPAPKGPMISLPAPLLAESRGGGRQMDCAAAEAGGLSVPTRRCGWDAAKRRGRDDG